MVACFTEGASPIHKATVVPRGNSLGMVSWQPDNDDQFYTRKQMLAMMDVCMGGLVAEELIYGEDGVTSGPSGDLKQVTDTATWMVERWGMSERVGVVVHKNRTGDRAMPLASEETRCAIDEEIKDLTDKAYLNAKMILHEKEHLLHLLAKELIEKETLTGVEVRAILGIKEKPKPPVSLV
ncbi:peptidase M41 [Baffinella frigidus]|nr:peptidase M41 [Cryptophyta sp. CCMP2293]